MYAISCLPLASFHARPTIRPTPPRAPPLLIPLTVFSCFLHLLIIYFRYRCPRLDLATAIFYSSNPRPRLSLSPCLLAHYIIVFVIMLVRFACAAYSGPSAASIEAIPILLDFELRVRVRVALTSCLPGHLYHTLA